MVRRLAAGIARGVGFVISPPSGGEQHGSVFLSHGSPPLDALRLAERDLLPVFAGNASVAELIGALPAHTELSLTASRKGATSVSVRALFTVEFMAPNGTGPYSSQVWATDPAEARRLVEQETDGRAIRCGPPVWDAVEPERPE